MTKIKMKTLSLFLMLAMTVSVPAHASVLGSLCDYFFPTTKAPANALDYVVPEGANLEGSLIERARNLEAKYPENVKMLDDISITVDTSSGKWVKNKKILVISIQDLSAEAQQAILDDFSRELAHNSISFAGKGHLYSRIGNKVYDHMGGAVRENAFRISTDDFSPVVSLSDDEFRNLKDYVHFAKNKYKKTIKGFNYDGAMNANGKIYDNCGIDQKHNCTSWMGLAPIGADGSTFKKVAGANNWDVHRAPSWWKGYLAAKSPESRVPFLVHFSNNSMDAAVTKLRSGETNVIETARQ